MRILIADDHVLIRAGLRQLIETTSDYQVTAEASSGSEALNCLETNCPDVMLLDISMPDGSGLDILKEVSEHYPDLKVLMLSMHSDMAHVKTALSFGACGFLVKDSAPAELSMALETVMKGQIYLSPRVSNGVVDAWVGHENDHSQKSQLSPRQQEILDLISEGFSTKEIAAKLGLSVKTIETHRSRMMESLGLNRGTELLRYALKQNRNHITSMSL